MSLNLVQCLRNRARRRENYNNFRTITDNLFSICASYASTPLRNAWQATKLFFVYRKLVWLCNCANSKSTNGAVVFKSDHALAAQLKTFPFHWPIVRQISSFSLCRASVRSAAGARKKQRQWPAGIDAAQKWIITTPRMCLGATNR